MKIRYMITHGYGMGGTIRTITNQANAMARAGHEVELVSVIRKRVTPYFAIDPQVRLRSLVDYTVDTAGISPWRLRKRREHQRRSKLSTHPGEIVPRDEYAASLFNKYVEQAVADYIAQLRNGVLVTSRPALNILAGKFASGKVVTVAQCQKRCLLHHQSFLALGRWSNR